MPPGDLEPWTALIDFSALAATERVQGLDVLPLVGVLRPRFAVSHVRAKTAVSAAESDQSVRELHGASTPRDDAAEIVDALAGDVGEIPPQHERMVR